MENPQNNELENALKKCEAEREEYLNGWKRAKADFINYQKDEAKRLEETAKFGNEELIKELLSVLDTFVALERMKEERWREEGQEPMKIKTQLESVLKKRGLEKIEVVPGQPFDPAFHESIEEVESSQPSGTITEEAGSGWQLYGKVIRAAKVKIAKNDTK